MTRRHHGFLFRFCSLALLLLALLPVTAPFSTFDLIDFFRDTPADTGSVTQAKAGGDKSAPVPGTVIGLDLSRPNAARRLTAITLIAPLRGRADIPLRL